MEQTLRDGLNDQILSIEVSLIRKFDEQTSDVPDILKLTLGEPDFNTPEHIKQAAIKGIEEKLYPLYRQCRNAGFVKRRGSIYEKQNII